MAELGFSSKSDIVPLYPSGQVSTISVNSANSSICLHDQLESFLPNPLLFSPLVFLHPSIPSLSGTASDYKNTGIMACSLDIWLGNRFHLTCQPQYTLNGSQTCWLEKKLEDQRKRVLWSISSSCCGPGRRWHFVCCVCQPGLHSRHPGSHLIKLLKPLSICESAMVLKIARCWNYMSFNFQEQPWGRSRRQFRAIPRRATRCF